jgi:hypothetical protein
MTKVLKKSLQVMRQFCPTMTSRGEIVKRVVHESGISVTWLARQIGISRQSLYLDFSNPEMSFDRILAIGRVLRHDFSADLKDLPVGIVQLTSAPPPVTSAQLQDCQAKLLDVQGQLISTLQELKGAMQELTRYKAKYGPELA